MSDNGSVDVSVSTQVEMVVERNDSFKEQGGNETAKEVVDEPDVNESIMECAIEQCQNESAVCQDGSRVAIQENEECDIISDSADKECKKVDEEKVGDEPTKEVDDVQGGNETAKEVVDEPDVNESIMECAIEQCQNESAVCQDGSRVAIQENEECDIISDSADKECKKVDEEKVGDEPTKEVDDVQGGIETAKEVVDEPNVNKLTMECAIEQGRNESAVYQDGSNVTIQQNEDCDIISDTADKESNIVDDVIIQSQSIERSDMQIDEHHHREINVNILEELSTVSATTVFEKIQVNEDGNDISNMQHEVSEKKLEDETYIKSLPASVSVTHLASVDSAETMYNTGSSVCEEVMDRNISNDNCSFKDVNFHNQLTISNDCENQHLVEHKDFSPVNEVEKIYSNEDENISEVYFLYSYFIHYVKLNKLNKTFSFFYVYVFFRV